MVAHVTWHSITIAAGAALVIAALVAIISHVGCVAPMLALAWLGTSLNVLRIIGSLLPGVSGWALRAPNEMRLWLEPDVFLPRT